MDKILIEIGSLSHMIFSFEGDTGNDEAKEKIEKIKIYSE